MALWRQQWPPYLHNTLPELIYSYEEETEEGNAEAAQYRGRKLWHFWMLSEINASETKLCINITISLKYRQ